MKTENHRWILVKPIRHVSTSCPYICTQQLQYFHLSKCMCCIVAWTNTRRKIVNPHNFLFRIIQLATTSSCVIESNLNQSNHHERYHFQPIQQPTRCSAQLENDDQRGSTQNRKRQAVRNDARGTRFGAQGARSNVVHVETQKFTIFNHRNL